MNYSSKLNNLLKNISTSVQKNTQKKAEIKKEEQKQETKLFDTTQINIKKDELKKDDLYGGMISLNTTDLNKSKNDNNTSKLKKLLNSKNITVKNNAVKNNDNVVETTNIKMETDNNNVDTENTLVKKKSLLSSVKSVSTLSATPQTEATETPIVEETPKREKSVEEIRTENKENTIKTIDKFVARIDMNLVDETNPLSPFGVKHYDFTDYETEYDDQNRVTKLTSKYNTGTDIEITYDENNNVTVNVSNGRTFTINDKGQLTSYNNYSYEYDANGKLIKTIDNKQNHVSYSGFEYDEYGNMIKDGIGGKFTYSYDNEGNVLSVKNGNNEIKYDTNGNIIKEKTNVKTITYEYDGNNNFVKATDENGNEYDKNGHIIKSTSVEKGVTYTREAKIAENGQKIISNKGTNEEGITVEFITDINGFDMNQTVTLSDGTTIETTFDSKEQKWSSYCANNISYINDKRFGMFARSGVKVYSQTVKKSDGTIVYSLDAPKGLNSVGMLFFASDKNNVDLKNLSFNNGEQVLVNEDMSLNVTKTDGVIDIYDYNTKTCKFELRESISPVNLTYDWNKDGIVDYKDYAEIYLDFKSISMNSNDRIEKYGTNDIFSLSKETSQQVLENIKNTSNLDLNYLIGLHNTLDLSEDFRLCNCKMPDIQSAIIKKIDDNKEKNYDFSEDGKLNIEDVKLFINALVEINDYDTGIDAYACTTGNHNNIAGMDLNKDGIISSEEKRALYGYDEGDDTLIWNIVDAYINELQKDEVNLAENISKLEVFQTELYGRDDVKGYSAHFYLNDIIQMLQQKLKELQ